MSLYLGNKQVSAGVYIETDRVVLSAAEYEALEVKDPNTLYFIHDDPTLEEVREHITDGDVHVTAEEKEQWNTPGVTEERVNELIATATAGGAKVATGSYKGTNAYGESNPTSLTFDFAPKFLQIYARRDTSSGSVYGGADSNGNDTVACHVLPTTYSSSNRYGFYYDSSGVSKMKRSPDGKTVSWYNSTDAIRQFNNSSYEYYWIAIG